MLLLLLVLVLPLSILLLLFTSHPCLSQHAAVGPAFCKHGLLLWGELHTAVSVGGSFIQACIYGRQDTTLQKRVRL